MWGRTEHVREQHSADNRCFIEKHREGKWEVWFDGEYVDTLPTRDLARMTIHWLKLWKAAVEAIPTRFQREEAV